MDMDSGKSTTLCTCQSMDDECNRTFEGTREPNAQLAIYKYRKTLGAVKHMPERNTNQLVANDLDVHELRSSDKRDTTRSPAPIVPIDVFVLHVWILTPFRETLTLSMHTVLSARQEADTSRNEFRVPTIKEDIYAAGHPVFLAQPAGTKEQLAKEVSPRTINRPDPYETQHLYADPCGTRSRQDCGGYGHGVCCVCFRPSYYGARSRNARGYFRDKILQRCRTNIGHQYRHLHVARSSRWSARTIQP